MTQFLRRILLHPLIVYLSAVIGSLSIIVSGGMLLGVHFPRYGVFISFVVGVSCLCLSWISFVLHSRVAAKTIQNTSGTATLAKQLQEVEATVDKRLLEHTKQQMAAYQNHTFDTLISLQQLKLVNQGNLESDCNE